MVCGIKNGTDGAVAYARLRLMDTDFNRTERQRKVLGQAMEKAKNSKFKTLRTLVGAVYPQISTSIGVDDVLALAKGAKKYYIGQTSGFPFSHQEMKIGKKSCVIPTTLESNVVQLHMFLYDQEQYDAPASVKEISNYIAKKTGLGDPGKDTETGKNIGVEGNNGGGQTGGKSEQPAAAPALCIFLQKSNFRKRCNPKPGFSYNIIFFDISDICITAVLTVIAVIS